MDTVKLVNRVPTSLLTYGPGLEEELGDLKFMVLVVPGNCSWSLLVWVLVLDHW
jgi:hypothetical protein